MYQRDHFAPHDRETETYVRCSNIDQYNSLSKVTKVSHFLQVSVIVYTFPQMDDAMQFNLHAVVSTTKCQGFTFDSFTYFEYSFKDTRLNLTSADLVLDWSTVGVCLHSNRCLHLQVFDYNSKVDYPERHDCTSQYNEVQYWEFYFPLSENHFYIRNQILLRSSSIPYETYSKEAHNRCKYSFNDNLVVTS